MALECFNLLRPEKGRMALVVEQDLPNPVPVGLFGSGAEMSNRGQTTVYLWFWPKLHSSGARQKRRAPQFESWA